MFIAQPQPVLKYSFIRLLKSVKLPEKKRLPQRCVCVRWTWRACAREGARGRGARGEGGEGGVQHEELCM